MEQGGSYYDVSNCTGNVDLVPHIIRLARSIELVAHNLAYRFSNMIMNFEFSIRMKTINI